MNRLWEGSEGELRFQGRTPPWILNVNICHCHRGCWVLSRGDGDSVEDTGASVGFPLLSFWPVSCSPVGWQSLLSQSRGYVRKAGWMDGCMNEWKHDFDLEETRLQVPVRICVLTNVHICVRAVSACVCLTVTSPKLSWRKDNTKWKCCSWVGRGVFIDAELTQQDRPQHIFNRMEWGVETELIPVWCHCLAHALLCTVWMGRSLKTPPPLLSKEGLLFVFPGAESRNYTKCPPSRIQRVSFHSTSENWLCSCYKFYWSRGRWDVVESLTGHCHCVL